MYCLVGYAKCLFIPLMSDFSFPSSMYRSYLWQDGQFIHGTCSRRQSTYLTQLQHLSLIITKKFMNPLLTRYTQFFSLALIKFLVAGMLTPMSGQRTSLLSQPAFSQSNINLSGDTFFTEMYPCANLMCIFYIRTTGMNRGYASYILVDTSTEYASRKSLPMWVCRMFLKTLAIKCLSAEK